MRFHGVSPDEIERDILEAKLPGDALTGRHWDDHDADNGAALAIPHEHIGDYRADVETLRMERDHLREGLGESRDLETPIGRKLDIVERLLRLLSEDD